MPEIADVMQGNLDMLILKALSLEPMHAVERARVQRVRVKGRALGRDA